MLAPWAAAGDPLPKGSAQYGIRSGLSGPDVAFSSISPWLNWATVFTGAALLYYLSLSPALAAGMLIAFALVLLVTQWLSMLPWPLWVTSLAIFVVAWVGQFIGHAVEGKRPSFFKDVQFLMIGPLWLLAAAYRRMGLGY